MAYKIKTNQQRKIEGWVCLGLWAMLITLGIVFKRVYGHDDWIVFFHLPAAVFLVISFHKLSYEFRDKYRSSFLRKRTG